MRTEYETYNLASRGKQMSNFNYARRNGNAGFLGRDWYADRITTMYRDSRPPVFASVKPSRKGK
jgi:hypothetical protein